MDIVLIAGLWLPSGVWQPVVDELGRRGHRAVAVALPGVDDEEVATLEEQVAAVVAAVDGCDRPIVVGHSAASTLAWLAADRRATAVHSVVMVGGFPSAHGSAYAAFFPAIDGRVPFPGWDVFEGPDSADLDADQRAAITAAAIPVLDGVATGIVSYHDERRHSVPVVMVCPEYSPADVEEWRASGDIPELDSARQVALVDIDSGHWPMVSCPDRLAALLAELAEASSG